MTTTPPPRPQPELFSTGIPSLDRVLDGGIPRRQTVIVAGDPGSGKTLMCSQVAFQTAARGLPVVLATVTSEPHDKLTTELSSFSFFRRELLGEQLFMMSIYASLKKGARETRELLVQTVRERGAKLLFIDGLRAIRDLWQDEALLREFLYELGIGLAAADCVGLFTTEYPVERLMTLPEATTVDGIVSVSVSRSGARRLRRLEVVKLRGRAHLQGEHLLQIGPEGVEVVPRLEALVPSDADYQPERVRDAFGLPELDALMEGGVPRGSTTLLAGSAGIGKTLLAAHFAADGARRGQPALFFTYHEPPPQLVARAQRVGLDLAPLLASGALQLRYLPPGEIEADVVARDLLAHVRRMGARRLVVDGLVDLEAGLLDAGRRRNFFAALAAHLRVAGATSLFTREVAKVVGDELDFSDTPLGTLGENLVLMRHVELRGQMRRILGVLKMRDSAYDGDVREFAIHSDGLRVLPPLRSAVGLLTGLARPLGGADDGPGSREGP